MADSRRSLNDRRQIIVHVITSVKFCLDFGNDECIIMGNFRARIASAFEQGGYMLGGETSAPLFI